MPELTRASATDPLATLDVFDDFISGTGTSGQIGALGWGFGGGTVASVTSAGHPGIIRRDTTTTITTLSYFRLLLATGNQPMLASEFFDLTAIFKLNTNDANTRVRIGFSSDATVDAPVSAVYLEKQGADTSWFGTVRNASTESRSAALVAVETTSFHKIRIRRIDASTVGFTFDALAEVSVTGANVPGAVAVHPFVQITNLDASSKTIDIDFVRLKITGLAR